MHTLGVIQSLNIQKKKSFLRYVDTATEELVIFSLLNDNNSTDIHQEKKETSENNALI